MVTVTRRHLNYRQFNHSQEVEIYLISGKNVGEANSDGFGMSKWAQGGGKTGGERAKRKREADKGTGERW